MSVFRSAGSSLWKSSGPMSIMWLSVLLLVFCVSIGETSAGKAGSVKWKYWAADYVDSSPAVGADGTIYVGSHNGYLNALNPDGSLKWKYATGTFIFSSPAIDPDGIIYVGSEDKYLYALYPNGTIKWRFQTGDQVTSSPAIGLDGTIYVGSQDNYLYAVNPEGTMKWRYLTGDHVNSSPAVGPDGTVFVGSNDYYLHAVNPDGTLKWKLQGDNWADSSPAIDTDGTIYIGCRDRWLYALNPEGTVKWMYKTDGGILSSPAIGADGTIYVGSSKYLYAVDTKGKPKWTYKAGDYVFSSPAVGADGIIYVGSDDKNIHAVTSGGGLKWKYKTDYFVLSSPAIAPDGTVYVGSGDGYLYAFYSSSAGPAKSPWPMFHRDLSHTAAAPFPVLAVAAKGTGSGTVISDLPGIDCGSTCSFSFPMFITVTVTANPTSNSDFTSWKGCTTVNDNVCEVYITGNITVTPTFTHKPVPAISSLSPASGTIGTAVTIKGKYFGAGQGSSTVTFDGTKASVSAWSDISITCTVPVGAATGAVVVTTQGGSSTGRPFTVMPPAISSLSPAAGTIGAKVAVKGKYFGRSQGSSSVTFDGMSASVSAWSDISITCTVPAGLAIGPRPVAVTNQVGESATKTFTVMSPAISSFSPTAGAIGTMVTIKGKYFGPSQGTSTVRFNGVAAFVSTWSDTSITCPVPVGATSGTVVVANQLGNSVGKAFTVKPPSISSLSPASGAVGTAVTIKGKYFGPSQGSSTVKFDGVTASVSTWSDTSIACTVPGGLATGSRPVVVTTPAGSSAGKMFTVTP